MKKKPHFRVDDVFCKENHIKPNALKMIVRKKLHFEEIGGWYDVSISVAKNLQFAKDNGIKVSRATLYNFCNENGVNPKGEGTKEETKNNISMKEEPKNKATNSVISSVEKQGGATYQTQQETPLKRNYEPIKWVNADEYRERCKLYQLFAERHQKIMSYKMAI